MQLTERMEGIVNRAFNRRFDKYLSEGVLLHGHNVDNSTNNWNSPLDQINTHMKMRGELKARGFKQKQDATSHTGELWSGKVEGVPHAVELKAGRAIISSDIGGSVSDGEYSPSGVNMEIGSAGDEHGMNRQLDLSAAGAKGNC